MNKDQPKLTVLQQDDDDVLPFDLRKAAISAFVIWQLMAVIFWLMPASNLHQALGGVNTPLWYYTVFTGSWQNWQMFAPNPANVDVYLSADITYQDGTKKTWVFPRMHDLGYLQKYQQERFRKMIENAHLDANQKVWPAVARFAALANNKQPDTNPVVHVDLTRHWHQIMPPGMPAPPYTSYMFYHADYPAGSLSK